MDQPTAPIVDRPIEDDRWYDEEHEQMPPRPRRRKLAPVPLALIGVLLVAAGFIGGVLVQKHEGGGSNRELAGARSAFGGAGAGAPGFAAGGARAASGTTTGEVASVAGNVLYVTDSDGTTVKVRVPSSATVSRNATSKASAIHPGDTVVVQGSANDAGTVTAGTVSAIASGVRSLSRLGALTGGGGAPSGAGSGPSGSAGGDVKSLFGG